MTSLIAKTKANQQAWNRIDRLYQRFHEVTKGKYDGDIDDFISAIDYMITRLEEE